MPTKLTKAQSELLAVFVFYSKSWTKSVPTEQLAGYTTECRTTRQTAQVLLALRRKGLVTSKRHRSIPSCPAYTSWELTKSAIA